MKLNSKTNFKPCLLLWWLQLPMLRQLSLDTCDATEGTFDIPKVSLVANRVLLSLHFLPHFPSLDLFCPPFFWPTCSGGRCWSNWDELWFLWFMTSASFVRFQSSFPCNIFLVANLSRWCHGVQHHDWLSMHFAEWWEALHQCYQDFKMWIPGEIPGRPIRETSTEASAQGYIVSIPTEWQESGENRRERKAVGSPVPTDRPNFRPSSAAGRKVLAFNSVSIFRSRDGEASWLWSIGPCRGFTHERWQDKLES